MTNYQSGYAPVNGTELYYEIKGEGHPVLFIHGNPLDRRMWDKQFEAFAENYKVIRFDLAGFGQSGIHNQDYSFIEDIHGLLQYLNIKKTHIVALSVGGMLSMDFTLHYPAMVEKLVLVSTGLSGWTQFSDQRVEFNERMKNRSQEGNVNQIVELLAEGWLAGPFRDIANINEEIKYLFMDMVRNNYLKERGLGKMLIAETKTIDEVSNIQVPTLIVSPELDFPEFIEIANFLTSSIKKSQKVVINGTAHMLNMEKPNEFNQLVMAFLK